MRVLVIGGSGLVGSMILPYLQQDNELTVFDLASPADSDISYVQGDITHFDDLDKAMDGQQAIVYMAMGSLDWDTIHGIETAYDINVKGLHLALKAAHDNGISQAVYTSSMSVYADLLTRTFPAETIPPDARDLYGFTKGLGEAVCLNAVRNWNMNINALRLCFPTPDDELNDLPDEKQLLATSASDVARAIQSALQYHGRFQTFMISGDANYDMLNMDKAKQLLNWTPTPR